MTDQEPTYYSLLQLQERLRDLVAACPMSQNVWITAELSDVRQSGGHCYMELLQKDERTGQTVAKARATIWANLWRKISADFLNSTGQPFASGLKVMVRVTAGYHPLYGMNLNITAVNSSYTMGERERKRREILERLKREGVINDNKQLEFPRPTQRIAVISSATAAGYGDFMNHLLHNPRRLRFNVRLFPATVQGEQTAASVIEQLEAIAAAEDDFDCVCIIRGGGATTDLDGFDDYRLALNVAQFPLPIIVGIGHERDTTVLDYIACQRVKTPTAAAEFLVGLGQQELDNVFNLGGALLQSVTDTLAGAKQQLAYIAGALPTAPGAAIERAGRRLDNLTAALARVSTTRLQPLQNRLDRYADALKNITGNATRHAATKLQGYERLIDALSPKATMRRGFSVTRINGKAITSTENITAGVALETELAAGTITSIVK
ncbi:MAG: exodeoxyribonuclease VII large subunit [Bacteroides sp.]|nr:exodeoxyribonuclease VII large subunit [Bacteroides sp.]MCM1379331.1 exodeoxyribonuclease VII large subunit [Bacteroides sp.]MCM1445010.1 exodeoxyribonuclease VII large subunit [Prevotella sp.]